MSSELNHQNHIETTPVELCALSVSDIQRALSYESSYPERIKMFDDEVDDMMKGIFK